MPADPALRVLATCVLLALPVHAQEPAAARTVTLQNLSAFPREEWFTVSVPFARGEVRGLPDLFVQGCPTVWQPFGARWPDGSLRQALCLARARLGASGEATLQLKPGQGPRVTGLAWPAADWRLRVEVASGGKTVTARPTEVAVLEQNAARRVTLSRCRVGDTGLVFEAIVETYAGQEHAPIDLALFFSDPTSKAMQRPVDHVAVVSEGRALIVRNAAMLAVRSSMTATGSRTVLLGGTALGDGQGVRRSGVLAPPLRGDRSLRDATILAASGSPAIGATRWSGTGAYGPFGHVPELPPWLDGPRLRAAFARRHGAFVATSRTQSLDPFRALPWALAKNPGQTGDQEDFGVVKLESVAATGLPSFLLEVEPSVQQEACRPVHFFEPDGEPVKASAHPGWVTWNGRTHWNCKVSKDRLGKNCPEPKFDAHGWIGKDRQHWSTLYPAGYYLLTGKHWVLRELQNEVQLYLSGQTVDPEIATSTTGAPRAAGRVMLSACWLYLCTGDEQLLARMNRRVDRIHSTHWTGASLADDKVRPFGLSKPDPRILGGACTYWSPWQDSLAAVGFAAFHAMAGNPRAGALADALALNVLRHGWSVPSGKAPRVVYAMRWRDGGVPPDPKALVSGDPGSITLASAGISVWALPAVEVARRAATRRADAALVERADIILRRMRASRGAAADGWFDRFGQWDAVRY